MTQTQDQSAGHRPPPELSEEQVVADLLWAINSSWLVTGPSGWHPVQLPTLSANEIAPRQLLAHVQQHASWRVGRYFEALILFYLSRIRQVTLVGDGIQVFGPDRQTRGELDFVFRSDNGSLIHWETAVKFYLCQPDAVHNGSHYPGPDPQDTLESKLNRLTTHQLTLPWEYTHADGRLEPLRHRHAIVKGRIFYPAGYVSARKPPLSNGRGRPSTKLQTQFEIHSQHCEGTWMRCSDAVTELSAPANSCEYFLMAKPNWLAPSVAVNGLDPKAVGDVLQQSFSESRSPVMLTELRPATSDRRQIIVVHDGWPGPKYGNQR